jgi:protein Mpv17
VDDDLISDGTKAHIWKNLISVNSGTFSTGGISRWYIKPANLKNAFSTTRAWSRSHFATSGTSVYYLHFFTIVATMLILTLHPSFPDTLQFQRGSFGLPEQQSVRVLGASAQAQTNKCTQLKLASLDHDSFSEDPPLEEEVSPSKIESLQAAVVTAHELQQSKHVDPKQVASTGIMVAVSALVVWKLGMDGDLLSLSSAQEMITRIPMAALDVYSNVLESSPIMTKAATSATVYTIGDIIAQKSTGTEFGDIDRMRTLRSMLAGGIGHGPLSHYWYHISDFLFNDVLHWTAWWSFIPKVVLDQSTWGPIWNNSYILLLGLMQRESLESMLGNVKKTTIPLILSGLKLWPLAHCVTYGLVPTEYRLLWVDMVEILWVVILATTAADAMGDNGAIAAIDEPTKVEANVSVDLAQQ